MVGLGPRQPARMGGVAMATLLPWRTPKWLNESQAKKYMATANNGSIGVEK
jgi:hypothetical protein